MAVRLLTRIGVVPDDERPESAPDAALVYEPTLGATARSKGGAYIIVAVKPDVPHGDEIAAFLANAVRHEYYYDESAGIPICLEKAIRTAYRKLAGHREAHGVDERAVAVAAAVIREHELYVATAGEVDAYLARQGRLLTIHDESRRAPATVPGLPGASAGAAIPGILDSGIAGRLQPQASPAGAPPVGDGEVHAIIWRGEVGSGDTLLLASREIPRRLGMDAVRRSLTTLHPESAAQHLHHQFIAEGGGAPAALLVVEVTEPAVGAPAGLSVAAGMGPGTGTPTADAAGEPGAGAPPGPGTGAVGPARRGVGASLPAPLRGAAATVGGAFAGAAARVGHLLPRRRMVYEQVTPLAARRAAQRRWARVVLAVLVVILVGGLGAWLLGGGKAESIRDAKTGEAALVAALEQVNRVFGGGNDLVAADPQKALTFLREAWKQLDGAQQAGVTEGKIRPLRDQVMGGLDRLYGVVRTGASTVVPPARISAAPDLHDLVRGPDGAAYSIDRSTQSVVRLDLARKTAQVVVKMGDGPGNGVGEPLLLAAGGPDVLIVDRNGGLWRWRPSDRTGRGTLGQLRVGGTVTWGTDIRDVDTYLRNADAGIYNLYVIDPSSEQVLRYTPAADGSGFPQDPTGYLATATDVSGWEQMFVDGDIYVLEPDGVTRYANGRPGDFQLGALPDEVDLRPGHDYRLLTASASRREGRIYVWDAKHGRVIAFDKATGDYLEQYLPGSSAPAFSDVRGMFVVPGAQGKAPSLFWAGPDRLYRTVLQPVAQPTPSPSGAASGAPGTTIPAGPTLAATIAAGQEPDVTTGYGNAVSVTSGDPVTIRVELTPASTGATVELYRRIDKTGDWTQVGTAQTDASGAAAWTQAVTVPAKATGYGRYVYFRVLLKPGGTEASVWSNAVRAVAD